MKIYYSNTDFNVSRPVITIGVFDGVHLGHVEILNRLKWVAEKVNGDPVVLTFWPHPRMVLKQDTEIKLINTLSEKEDLLAQNGVKHLVVLPFTEEFSLMSSEDFVKKILIDVLNVSYLIVGFNHHFGHGREGNFDFIQKAAKQFNFTVEKLDAQLVENEKVSSTLIRKSLSIGNVSLANKYLGYIYSITGKVIRGSEIGRTIGFPTANILMDNENKILPHIGVYIGQVKIGNDVFPAMINIGVKPTINSISGKISIEAHILDFSGDIYGKALTVYFHQRIRDEMKFNGIEELKEQLEKDKIESINYFNNLKY